MSQRILYDLAGEDEAFRFSPYCWRIKLALAHKNLSYETVPWRFTDKDAIAFSGQDKVPVLIDGDREIAGSQTIAEYLETQYPNGASLFGEPPGPGLTNFTRAWTEDVLHRAIGWVVTPEILPLLHPKDRSYFKTSREASYKTSFADIAAARASHADTLHKTLSPLRRILHEQEFISGTAPAYADHIVFGALHWGRLVAARPLLEGETRIETWMDAVLNAYGLDA
jgi:glutathione S-transferase